MHSFKSILILHLGASIKANEAFPTPQISPSMGIRAIVPTTSGQMGINPAASQYYQTTTMMPDDPIPSRPVIHDGATSTIAAPFAVVTKTNGDIVFPINPASKSALQALFDEVTAACAGAKKKIRKRSGQCEANYLSRPGVGGGILDFDIDALSISTFTMGDIAVGLENLPGAVAVAFLAYAIGDGKVVDDVAPKVPQTTTSQKLVPTTTREDVPDSLFTADSAAFEAMAAEVQARIALGDPEHLWSDDKTKIPAAECDRSKLLNVETTVIKDLSAAFCDDLDYKSPTSRDLTNKDANTDLYADYTFNMKWMPTGRVECHDLNCKDLYSTFASTCGYNSHTMYTTGNITMDCGAATFQITKSDDDDEGDTGSSDNYYCTSSAECQGQECGGFKASCGTFGAPGVNDAGLKSCQCFNPPLED